MKAEINNIRIDSKFFARVLEGCDAVDGLNDETVYVCCQGDANMKSAMSKVNELLRERSSYHVEEMPADADIPVDSPLYVCLDDGHDIILPLCTPDRDDRCFLVGTVLKADYLESAVAFMISDAERIAETCKGFVPASTNCDNMNEVDERSTETSGDKRLGNDSMMPTAHTRYAPSFRGFAIPHPEEEFGPEAAQIKKDLKRGKLSHNDCRDKLRNIVDILKRLDSKIAWKRERAETNLAKAVLSLSDREKNALLLKLIREVKPDRVQEIVDSVTDRKTMGRATSYKVLLKKRERGDERYRFHDSWNYLPFFVNSKGERFPIIMQKQSLTVYVLSLIERCTSKGESDVSVDVVTNEEAFKEVFKKLFNTEKDEPEKKFKDLGITPTSKGMLNPCYGDIDSGLHKAFEKAQKTSGMSEVEDCSPFLVGLDVPLAVEKDKIELPDDFLEVRVSAEKSPESNFFKRKNTSK